MTEDTNSELITPAASNTNEIIAPSAASVASTNQSEAATETSENISNNEQNESPAEESTEEPAEASTEVPADEQNNDSATTPQSPCRRIAWYDILMFVLFFLTSQLLGAFIAVKLGILPADSTLFSSPDFEVVEGAEYVQGRFVAASLFAAMILCFIMLRIYRSIRGWRLKPSNKARGWASPFRLLCGYLLLWCISIAVEPLTSLLPDSQSNIGGGGWLLVSAVVIAPIFEEYIFRRHIAGALQFAYGSVVAWLLSSLIFGIAHGAPAVMVTATMSGLVLGYYFLRYRSIVIAILLHAMNNITVCFLHTLDASELTLRELVANDSIYWMVQIACSVVSLAALVHMFLVIRGIKNEKYLSEK